LKNISFEVKPGQLVGVIGAVGSGKSSLLLALLGEMPSIKGESGINGKIFYVSQEPWIFSATIRQNILFGKKFDRKKFEKIIDVCALRDVKRLVSNKPILDKNWMQMSFLVFRTSRRLKMAIWLLLETRV
jgi:ATP-binding cassette subfamily C (CFTR/MRP) protein 4